MDTQSIKIPDETRVFLDSLIQDAGLTMLDEQMHEDMLKQLYARFDNFLTSVIVEKMPPEHLEKFIQMNEQAKPKAEIESFMKEKIPNAEEVFANAFLEFRDLYLGNIAVARHAPKAS